MSQPIPDSLAAWMDYYLEVAVQGVRSAAVTEKIRLHLQRFHICLRTINLHLTILQLAEASLP